jgi:hypothetical protein
MRQKILAQRQPVLGIAIQSVKTDSDGPLHLWQQMTQASRNRNRRVYCSRLAYLRGGQLLIEPLNHGTLGFAFADLDYGNIKETNNHIKLVGPGIPALRVKEGKLTVQPVP